MTSSRRLGQQPHRYKPVVQFLSTQKLQFVSGYQAMVNCPTTRETKNTNYALTCPCGQLDYIGYTLMTLSQRLFCSSLNFFSRKSFLSLVCYL